MLDIRGIIAQNTACLTHGGAGAVSAEQLAAYESELGFSLPQSYKRLCLEYEFIEINGLGGLKLVAPPELAEFADADILYSYRANLEAGILNANELAILETDDEIYYFAVGDGADKGAEDTGIDGDANANESARTSIGGGADKETDKIADKNDGTGKGIAVNASAKDSEYPVFCRDLAQGSDEIFASNFTEFLNKILAK